MVRVILGKYPGIYPKMVEYRTWILKNVKNKEDYDVVVDSSRRSVVIFKNDSDATAFKLRFDL